MGRSDSERAQVLSAMLPSVSAAGPWQPPRRANVVDLTPPRAYAAGLAARQRRSLAVAQAAKRGLATVGRRRNVAFRRWAGGDTWPFDGSGGGGGPGAGELGLA